MENWSISLWRSSQKPVSRVTRVIQGRNPGFSMSAITLRPLVTSGGPGQNRHEMHPERGHSGLFRPSQGPRDTVSRELQGPGQGSRVPRAPWTTHPTWTWIVSNTSQKQSRSISDDRIVTAEDSGTEEKELSWLRERTVFG